MHISHCFAHQNRMREHVQQNHISQCSAINIAVGTHNRATEESFDDG